MQLLLVNRPTDRSHALFLNRPEKLFPRDPVGPEFIIPHHGRSNLINDFENPFFVMLEFVDVNFD